jgi:hypothetical protein
VDQWKRRTRSLGICRLASGAVYVDTQAIAAEMTGVVLARRRGILDLL